MTGRRFQAQPDPETGRPTIPMHDMGPGDYCGPLTGWTGDKPAVFFFLPNARDEDAPPGERGLHHVVSPPHTFIEEDDGSLTVQPSILSRWGRGGADGWHGFLERGVWRSV